MQSGTDYTREAQKIWNALRPMIDQEINIQTRSMVRAKKMTVMSPPNGATIGVAEPFGQTINIPYSSALANVRQGDPVWVYSYFSNASTMIAMATGEGQFFPDYEAIESPALNLLAASSMVRCTLNSTGDLSDPSAARTDSDYYEAVTTPALIPATGGAQYTLTQYDTRAENIYTPCQVAAYDVGGTFLGYSLSAEFDKPASSKTFTLHRNAAFLRATVIGYPKYRWKLEQGPFTTAWQISPQDIL